ncbi:MAG: YqaE/Pmp3 family membrane protein [Planctomycetota bacterium]
MTQTAAHPSPITFSDVFKVIFAIILPPLGVLLEVGLTKHFWINILLTILGFIPGIIHALYVILTR